MGPHNVILSKLKRVAETVVHVSLSGKVHYGVNLLGLQNIVDQVRTANVALDKFVVGQALDIIKVLKA